MDTFTIIILCLVLWGILSYFIVTFGAGYFVFTRTLKRRSKEQWGRGHLTDPTSQHIDMDNIGQTWYNDNKQYKKDVHIINEGLNLYGEYYDFGNKKAVMVLSGRTESLRYGYFFAKPYVEMGYNVLVMDPRAHGESDGTYNTIGFEESKDMLVWAKLLHDKHGVEEIVFHGICIGSAGGMYAITSGNCPDYIKGLVAEGMFTRFEESMRNHLKERKKNMYPIMHCINFWMHHYTGHTMSFGPIDVMHKMDRPLLMLHSKLDTYSRPELAEKLYGLCPVQNKKLVWFNKGGHSLLRITDMELYDSSIKAFLATLQSKEPTTV